MLDIFLQKAAKRLMRQKSEKANIEQRKCWTDLEVVLDESQLSSQMIIGLLQLAYFHPADCVHCPCHRWAGGSQELPQDTQHNPHALTRDTHRHKSHTLAVRQSSEVYPTTSS